MMDKREELIDSALDSLPLAPTPPGFTSRVMARIQQSELTFHLDFLDLALPGFFALCATAAFGSVLALLAAVNPLTLKTWSFQLQVTLLRTANLVRLPAQFSLPESLEPWLFAGGLCAGVLLLLLAALLVWLLLDRAPRLTGSR